MLAWWTLSPKTSGHRTTPVPRELISLNNDPVDGTLNAPVAIIEYSDFECPFCRQFATKVLPDLRRTFLQTGRAQLVFRHFPLSTIHKQAQAAAVLALCADAQARFWPVHDRLFELTVLSQDAFVAVAKASALDLGALDLCTRFGSPADQSVTADVLKAANLGVFATPTFFVGRVNNRRQLRVVRIIQGSQSYADFAQVIGEVEATDLRR